ncbi:hypothetical protein [Blackfly microvirus SF02]|uniref:Uncharacterized protein n=1 Tax=Blackfly microvirus SF02 TaxID=2576452 RepID=A0A4P8PL18_9VIRU|nr:hypothetical protein [Blackfly microvirus SF02]
MYYQVVDMCTAAGSGLKIGGWTPRSLPKPQQTRLEGARRNQMDRRHSVNRKGSHKAFKSRANKTHRLNTGSVLRGGTRL